MCGSSECKSVCVCVCAMPREQPSKAIDDNESWCRLQLRQSGKEMGRGKGKREKRLLGMSKKTGIDLR